MCHANVNLSLIVKNTTQIKSGIMISVVVSVKIQKNSLYERDFFGVLKHIAAKMINREEVLLVIQ